MKISNQAVSFAAALLVASPFANADTKILSGTDSIIRELKSKVSAVARFGRRLEDVQGLYDTTIVDGCEVIDHKDFCNPDFPDFDQNGMVCYNDGQPDEAYCDYSFGPNACVIGCKMDAQDDILGGLENLDDQISMQDLQDFLDEVDTSQMDDSVANLFDGMAELMGDEDFVQCSTDQTELMASNPEIQVAEDALGSNVDDIMNSIDMNTSGNKLKMNVDIPESAMEAGKSACLAAGANWLTYSKFNCEINQMGIKVSMKVNNLGGCMPDTDACANINNGEYMERVFDMVGFECDVRVSGGAGRSLATATYLAGIVAVASAVFGI